MNESYHTQHAPFGAFASFTVGLVDSPGGFGQCLRGPARQNVYVGFRNGGGRWKLLPFFKPAASQVVAFTGPHAPEQKNDDTPYSLRPYEYRRTLRWASDTWEAEGFRFTLHSPLTKVPDPASLSAEDARFQFAPVVCGFVEYDNSAGKTPVELIFGINEPDQQIHPIGGGSSALTGFAGGESFGFATVPNSAVALRQGFSLFSSCPQDYRGLHILGPEAGFVFTVAPGERRQFPIALGFYEAGTITTGLTARFAYTQWFDSLLAVLRHGLDQRERYAEIARTRDAELERSRLNADQKYLLAQATHSYRGSTQLLTSRDGLVWVVNEGEYRMINTFDLTVDHLFFELEWHPWTVRNALDLFSSRYSYTDQVRTPEGTVAPGGISFTHDMGVSNHFTEPGRSSYECDNLTGCFSHMTMEQLLNWVLTATVYAAQAKDWEWLEKNRTTLQRCVESLEIRDHPDPARRDGLLKCDSTRCASGSEITTYDSLDVSLGQSRNNLYLAVKALGAWLLVRKAFERLGRADQAERARANAERLTKTLLTKFEKDTGFFPAVFEKNNRSRILPAVEGLAYPLYLGMDDLLKDLTPLLEQLRTHLRGAFQPGVCIDAKSGGWKMSSTSTNTWFSKIAIAQYVVRKLFPDTLSPAAAAADRVHADWQRQPGCGAFAMCDQILSDTGETCGSRYYPRGVTAWLWLLE